MAALGLEDEELKFVEQMLQRVSHLSSSIQSLKMDLLKSNPLPSASSLQASAQILQRNLQTVLNALSENSDVFTRMAIHPSTNYPGRTQEGVLTQLLRKKLEPDVEELVAQGRETSHLATPEGIEELQGIWHELRGWTLGRIRDYATTESDDVYTAEERAAGIENVRTGLRRDIEEEEDDEEEELNEGEGGVPKVRGPEPETLLWFSARGDFEVPRNVEYERKVGAFRGLDGVSFPSNPVQPDSMQGVSSTAA